MSTAYTPLWCKSNFSFLEAASHPEELVQTCHAFGLKAMALTDRGGVYGIVRAWQKARELGLHLIVGSELSMDDDSTMVLLAEGRRGYSNLCRLLSEAQTRGEPAVVAKGVAPLSWEKLCQRAEGLVALWGGERSLLVGEAEPMGVARSLKEAFGERLYAMVARHRRAEETRREAVLRARARRYDMALVAAVEVLYHSPARRPLHDVLSCIRHHRRLSDIGTLTRPNAEYDLKTPENFTALFHDDPAAVAHTQEVASRCDFSLAQIRYRYPNASLADGTTSLDRLRRLTFAGARQRYGNTVPKDVMRQLERELALINELDYPGYFLTMHEIVGFCRDHGILCQGRGSAANSAVCYCLGITAIDPVRMGLLFERFISRERGEPPDIDLDIEHRRREEVIEFVYRRYGRSHAAMVANVVSYRSRSALREVGRALGLPAGRLDRLARLVPRHGDVTAEAMEQAGMAPADARHSHLLRLANELLRFPRHLSIHPGGFLIGREPVSDIVPIEKATMEGRTVIQWDKDDLDALGLFKVDLLGLGALTQLHMTFDLIAAHRGLELSLATIPAEDPLTFEMASRADTVGVFQIESRAQMAMLPRLRPKNFYDLVIEVGIVRPGPISGGMVHPFLRRRQGIEKVEYAHPSLRRVLEKTLGIPLFQEQVMRLAVVAADYTAGEADQLRRDMAAWRKYGRIGRHRERLLGRMLAKGIRREFAERVFEQIRGFGEYGFPESHAASFALIAYATAWLKRHYPAEFTCALLNAQPMGFYSPATIVEDAKHHGIEVRPVDIACSEQGCTLEPLGPDSGGTQGDKEPAFAVRMGLGYLKGLSRETCLRIESERRISPFSSIGDLGRRARLDEKALKLLAESGALEAIEAARRRALWEALGVARGGSGHLPGPNPPPLAPLNMLEAITWDYRSSRHSTRGHPLSAWRTELKARGLPDARTVAAMADARRCSYVGMVICRQRPVTASGVMFMTLEDESGFVNVVVWPKVAERYALVAKTASMLEVRGYIQARDGMSYLIADSLWRPRLAEEAAASESRDFR